jgi:hypothetical protein
VPAREHRGISIFSYLCHQRIEEFGPFAGDGWQCAHWPKMVDNLVAQASDDNIRQIIGELQPCYNNAEE